MTLSNPNPSFKMAFFAAPALSACFIRLKEHRRYDKLGIENTGHPLK